MRDAVVRDAVVRDAVVRDAVVRDAVVRECEMPREVYTVWKCRLDCARRKRNV